MLTRLFRRLLALLSHRKAPATAAPTTDAFNHSEGPSWASQEPAYRPDPPALGAEDRWRKATARALPCPAPMSFEDSRVPFTVRHRRVNVFNLPDLIGLLRQGDQAGPSRPLPHPLSALLLNPAGGPVNVPASLAGMASHSGLDATVLSLTADHQQWFDYCVVYETSGGMESATIITSTGEIILGFRTASSIARMLSDDVREKLGLSPKTQVFSYWYRWDTPMLTWEIVPTLSINHG